MWNGPVAMPFCASTRMKYSPAGTDADTDDARSVGVMLSLHAISAAQPVPRISMIVLIVVAGSSVVASITDGFGSITRYAMPGTPLPPPHGEPVSIVDVPSSVYVSSPDAGRFLMNISAPQSALAALSLVSAADEQPGSDG